jgi:hypothetical protein
MRLGYEPGPAPPEVIPRVKSDYTKAYTYKQNQKNWDPNSRNQKKPESRPNLERIRENDPLDLARSTPLAKQYYYWEETCEETCDGNRDGAYDGEILSSGWLLPRYNMSRLKVVIYTGLRSPALATKSALPPTTYASFLAQGASGNKKVIRKADIYKVII